jgi:tetratricopeptide (TPR) repeat protein
MLPPLKPLDRPATLAAINQALADGDQASVLDTMGANPLAIFSWIMVDGIQNYYLKAEQSLLNRYAAIAVLFRRWVEEVFSPENSAESLAHSCLLAQLAYLRHMFGRLQDRPAEGHEAARKAHRLMTQASLASQQQHWPAASEGFASAFDSWRTAEDPYFQSQVAADWAAVLEQEGEYESALDKLIHAVQVAVQLGDLERLGRRRLHKGKISLMLGLAEEAIVEYREAAGAFRVTQDMYQFVVALTAEGEVLKLMERHEEAQASVTTALLTAKQLDDPELLAFIEQAANH